MASQMILKGQLGIKAKNDATRVAPITGTFVGDSLEVQDAANRRIRALGNVAYSTLRFLPYTRWATDALDITGLSPDIDSPDFTDVTQGASHVGRGWAKANYLHYRDLPIGKRIKVGPRKRHPYMTVTLSTKDDGMWIFNKIGNGFKHLGLVGFGGDIIQTGLNLKELYNAELNYLHVLDSVRSARRPYIKRNQEGGVINPLEEKDFVLNWLNARKDVLHENMNYQGDVNAEIARQVRNMLEYSYENSNSDEFKGETDHANKVVRVTPSASPTTLLHEVVHTAIRRDSPQILKAKLILLNNNIIDYNHFNEVWKNDPSRYKSDIKRILHHEKPTEVVPRLYEFRKEHNLDPNKVYTEEEIAPLILKSKIPSVREGFYDLKTFTKALNEVAYNNKLNTGMMAKKGGKTHKPFGHRSILDNGWQSTKLLKDKKNVYGKR